MTDLQANSPIYRKALMEFFQHGTPIAVAVKAIRQRQEQERVTTHYIWRARHDEKVRVSHAANNGKIFSWDKPPLTGHPGEDYNCRCIAEPYIPGHTEYIYQELTENINYSLLRWVGCDFVLYSLFGSAEDITLSEIGHLKEIIDHYAYATVNDGDITVGAFNRINQKVIDEARKIRNGSFMYKFGKSYDFKEVSYPHGGATVGGKFTGSVSETQGMLFIEGFVDYYFYDEYTDALGIRQNAIGISNPIKAEEIFGVAIRILDLREASGYQKGKEEEDLIKKLKKLLDNTKSDKRIEEVLNSIDKLRKIEEILIDIDKLGKTLEKLSKPTLSHVEEISRMPSAEEMSKLIIDTTEIGASYKITDKWQTKLTGVVLLNEAESKYQSGEWILWQTLKPLAA